MNLYQTWLAGAVLTFLQSKVKNPKLLAKELTILAAIRDTVNMILAANGAE